MPPLSKEYFAQLRWAGETVQIDPNEGVGSRTESIRFEVDATSGKILRKSVRVRLAAFEGEVLRVVITPRTSQVDLPHQENLQPMPIRGLSHVPTAQLVVGQIPETVRQKVDNT